MGIEKQGAKPTGTIGKMIGRAMNIAHTKTYINYLKDRMPGNYSCILDLGCGGGKFLKYLANNDETYKLYGLDHSHEMVELARKINHKVIKEHRLEVLNASVNEIPIADNECDLVTAFETVQFWPDIEKSFNEIARVLKPTGDFMIINRFPKRGTKWYEFAQLKNESDYKKLLQLVGFKEISLDLYAKKGWIIVNAKK